MPAQMSALLSYYRNDEIRTIEKRPRFAEQLVFGRRVARVVCRCVARPRWTHRDYRGLLLARARCIGAWIRSTDGDYWRIKAITRSGEPSPFECSQTEAENGSDFSGDTWQPLNSNAGMLLPCRMQSGMFSFAGGSRFRVDLGNVQLTPLGMKVFPVCSNPLKSSLSM